MDTNRFLAVLRRLDEGRRFVDQSSEQVLGQFANARDEGALRELMARHGRHVWAVCRHEAGCPGLADDAFQSVFLALNQHAGSIRRPGSLAYWLDKTARRTARRMRRSQARRVEIESIRASLLAARDESDDAERQDVADAVRKAVAELPDRYRLPVIYRYLNDLSPPEIATLLGLPEGTVKAQLNRGLKVLGHKLASRGLGAGATAAAIEGTLAGIAEAVPPAIAVATVKNVAAARLATGGIAMLWIWLMKASPLIWISLAGLGLAGGTAAVMWRRDVPKGEEANVAVVAETAEERDLRLLNDEVAPKLVEALRPLMVFGGAEIRVVRCELLGTVCFCELEAAHKFGFRSIMNFRYQTLNGGLTIGLDQFANGQWKEIDPVEPIRLGEKGKSGFMPVSLESTSHVFKAFSAIPLRIPPTVFPGREAGVSPLVRPFLGKWRFRNDSRYIPDVIYVDAGGRIAHVDRSGRTDELKLEIRPGCAPMIRDPSGVVKALVGTRLCQVHSDSDWWDREDAAAPPP